MSKLLEQMNEVANKAVDYPKEIHECKAEWHYILARNMLHGEWERGKKHSSARARAAGDMIARLALAIIRGGYLKLWQPQDNPRWYINLVHPDGLEEEVVNFRRKKRAVTWIGFCYLFALDKPGNPR